MNSKNTNKLVNNTKEYERIKFNIISTFNEMTMNEILQNFYVIKKDCYTLFSSNNFYKNILLLSDAENIYYDDSNKTIYYQSNSHIDSSPFSRINPLFKYQYDWVDYNINLFIEIVEESIKFNNIKTDEIFTKMSSGNVYKFKFLDIINYVNSFSIKSDD